MSDSRDENLLFGILALQLDFINQEQLVAAANAWMVSKTSRLGDLLVKLGSLSKDDLDFVDLIVKKHIARSGSPKSSLNLLQQHESVSGTADHIKTVLAGATEQESNDRCIQHDATTVWMPSKESNDSRFVRLRELASGGLGIVSVARDQELEREVALKEMLHSKRPSSDAFERFVAEAKITGNLEHPGIVPIYGLGSAEDGSPYYAMRLIRGRSMHEEVALLHGNVRSPSAKRDFRRLDAVHLRKLLRSLALACNAVAYAHSRGVIHRDLKPGNIMLGKFGETIVVDWGLAKVTGGVDESQLRSELPVRDSRSGSNSETVHGAVLGTPSYMSPEQAAGHIELIDRRSDVFGMGACLYAILTNLAPFKGNSKAETIANAAACRLTPLREIDGSIPSALEAICLKAMAPEPKDRYDTAIDLADDIDRWIAGDAVVAMPDPVVQRVFRWARRHQTLVSSTAVLLVTAIVGLSIASFMINEQRNIASGERDRANEAAKESDFQRDKASKALVRSEESNAASLDILEKFVEGLGDDGWAGVPQMEQKRIEMVDLAVARFQKLFKDNPDDLDIKVKMIRLLVRSANLYRMVGKLDKASEHFTTAMGLIQSLEQNDQLNKVGLSVVGDSLYAYANLVEEQKGAKEALVSCKQGIAICRKRLQLESDSLFAKLGLTMALVQAACLQHDTAEFDESIANAREGQRLLTELASTALGKQSFHPLFNIIAYDAQIKALLMQAKYEEAEELIKKTDAVRDSARAAFPDDNNIEFYCLQLNHCAAKLAFARKLHKEGVAKQLETIDSVKKLASKYPDTVAYQSSSRDMYLDLGIESFLSDDLTSTKKYLSLALDGKEIAQPNPDSPIGELKTEIKKRALAIAVAKREGTNFEEQSKAYEAILARLQASDSKCRALGEALRLSSVPQ